MAERSSWAFLTSHGSVLLQVAGSPDSTVREIAEAARLTERQAHRVLADLVDEGYIVRERRGRRNHYRVNSNRPMKHPLVADKRVGELLSALGR
ncbi:MAG TPA: MarR family transcriptional regulator [Gaiellaceae bacterium]|nr:MarR family transcriptional regulator [Gaiellaceae bacterium]